MRYVILILTILFSTATFAQTAQIKQLEQKRKQTLQEISNTDALLQNTKKTASTILDRIELISKQIVSRKKVVGILNKQVESLDEEEKAIEEEIIVIEAALIDKRGAYAKAIGAMQSHRKGQSKIIFVLSGKSLSESYRRFHYLRDFSVWVSKQASDIEEQQVALKTKKSDLAKAKYDKVALLRQREREHENLQKEETNYQKEAVEVKKQQKDLQVVLRKKKRQAQALDKQIEKLIAKEIARQEKKAKKEAREEAQKGTKTPESGTATTPPATSVENLKLSKDFVANKGRLPYPITGTPSITGKFGTHYHAKWKVSTTSNGIDIQSQAGTHAIAVSDGEVTKIIAFPGYNNCIIVRHGSYYTFYGNILEITVQQGAKVKAGQSLGEVYTDPDTNSAKVHFQLWKGTTKLNPEPWIKR